MTKIKRPTRQALREGIALARRRYAEEQGMGELAGAIIGPLLWQHDRLAALCRRLLDTATDMDLRAEIEKAIRDSEESGPGGARIPLAVPAPKSKESDGAAVKAREKAGKLV